MYCGIDDAWALLLDLAAIVRANQLLVAKDKPLLKGPTCDFHINVQNNVYYSLQGL